MKNVREVFKLVNLNDDGSFRSWNLTAPTIEDVAIGLVLKYEIGKVTKPLHKKAPIFAFDTFEHAMKFAWGGGKCAVLRCEAKGVVRGHAITGHPTSARNLIEMLNFQLLNWRRGTIGWDGTLMCDSIKPIEVVEIYEGELYER